MSIDANNIESIVRSVLAQMVSPVESAPAASGPVPSKARLAYLTGEKKIEVKEVPMPQVGDDEILVKVEGCGICGTDVHEWKGDPFGLIPVVLGHEGTGEVVALGKNIKKDTSGNPIRIGDKVVTSVLLCDECDSCKMHPDTPNLCESLGVYGLMPDDDVKLNGWFASHILIRKNSTFFVVNDLNLNKRMLLELAAVCVHALNRANSTGLLNFKSTVVVQGCGPVGLMQIAVVKAFGISKIIAIDGDANRLEMAKRLGATATVNFKELGTIEERVAKVKSLTNGVGADFAFQCTGSPYGAADIYKYIRRGGGLCEQGFFVDNGNATINPHFDLCNKEINLVGSWVYGAHEYPMTIDFLKRAEEMNLPIEELITHKYSLDNLNEAMETNVSQKGIKIAYVANN